MIVHVSIHDVTPRYAREVEILVRWAGESGIRPALLVVPNYHAEWPLADHPEFCARLRVLQALGHELYLHGYYHRAQRGAAGADRIDMPARLAPSGLRDAAARLFHQRLLSANEAEFADTSSAEAAERIRRGRAELLAAGLSIDGFVAPAWALPRALRRILADHAIAFTEDHLRVYDPTRNVSRATLLINYATRSRVRLASTLAFDRLARLASGLLPVRLALHPSDLRSSVLCAELPRLLSWAARGTIVRGSELLPQAAT